MSPKQASKFLSLILRHEPQRIGLELDSQGWAPVSALLDGARAHGVPLTRELLLQVVRESDKQRFALSEDGERIRANQGHSVEVDLALAPQAPPAELFHGTVPKFLESILATGLTRQQRHHVHLSPDIETATRVGARRGDPVVLIVDAAQMALDGHVFYCSENGVWLTDHVPPKYLRQAR